MSLNPDSESSPTKPAVVGRTGIGRRRLLRAGLSVAPAYLAVSGRSAMAIPVMDNGPCPKGLSPVAWASVAPNGTCVGVSHAVGRNTLGRTPTDWKPVLLPITTATFTSPWPGSVLPFANYMDQASDLWANIAANDPRWATGTTFQSIFGGGRTESFSRILIDDLETSLDRKLCAAYLNALTVPNYALSVDDVVKLATGVLILPSMDAFLDQTWP